MSNFESFPPAESREKGVVDGLLNKFPKLKTLILAFATAASVMSAPELTKAEVGTAEAALEKINDKDFKDVVKKIESEMFMVGSNIPTNSTYKEVWNCIEVNKGATFSEKKDGVLPESAENVSISSECMSGMISKDGAEGGESIANMMDGTASAFSITPVEIEKGTVIEGGKVEIDGIGSTRVEALQNALEHSVMFLGEEVETDKELNTETKDTDHSASTKTAFNEIVKRGGKHFIQGYKIVKGEEVDGGAGKKEYKVTVEVRGGQFTPEK
ncbi:MAG: hypothetical protein NTV72_00925 [Candidatus Taylorbacteria bacterium]|nr:hypothetical protein [Candidatus Taylorbacteria bacterium]